MAIVTLTTDFGTEDGYVGAMKGVVLAQAPDAQLIDIAHDIPPQDIEAGAWCVGACWSYFPEGTIHVAVVDPGVGSDRQALLACVNGHYLVGPDNGLFTHPLRSASDQDVRFIRPDLHLPVSCSATFHGRDIFAYVAGLLASGRQGWTECSVEADSCTLLAAPEPDYKKSVVKGRIIHIDRYGNLITNIEGAKLPDGAQWTIGVGGAELSVRDIQATYSDVEEGRPVALIGSSGMLEVAVHGASAYRVFQVERGATITMRRLMQQSNEGTE